MSDLFYAFLQCFFSAFAVVNQVLGLKDASVFNTIVTTEGRVFVQNPGNVLGVDAATSTASAESKSAKAKSARWVVKQCVAVLKWRALFSSLPSRS
jgi:hypothetical protein